MHINQAFCPVCIQVVSLYIVDEAIGAPTTLCRRGVNYLRKQLHRQFMQSFGRGAIHVPPFDSTQPVSIFGSMQVTKDSMLTDVFAQFASYLSTLLFIRYQLLKYCVTAKNILIPFCGLIMSGIVNDQIPFCGLVKP
jgi:hypothetical protein